MLKKKNFTKDSDIDLNMAFLTPFNSSTRSATGLVIFWLPVFVWGVFKTAAATNVGCGLTVPRGIIFKYSKTSPFNTRLPLPVGVIFFKSTLFSIAILRTAGVARTLPSQVSNFFLDETVSSSDDDSEDELLLLSSSPSSSST